MTRAHRSAVPSVYAHRRTRPARSLAPCATHPRTSDSPLLGHTRWSPEGAKGTGTAPERSAELLLRAREAPYGGRRGKERRVQAQRCRRGPGRAGILGLAPCYAPNGFGGCSPAVFRPCPALLPLARLTAGHKAVLPTHARVGAVRSQCGRHNAAPSAAPAPPPPALHLPLPAGRRAGRSGRGQRSRHMPRRASPPPYGKRRRAGRSGGRPMCSATRRDAGTCGI